MAYDAPSTEGRDRSEALMRLHGDMESERANLDSLYERIAGVVCPDAEGYVSKNQVQGDLKGERVFDTTPCLALDRFGSAIGSYLVPDADQWHGLKATDDDLKEDEEVKEYLEAVTNILFSARYRPKANFSAQMSACFRSLGAFGPWCLFTDEAMGAHLRYRALHLSEIYFGENHQGLIDRVHRGKFELKAYQVEQKANDPDPKKRWVIPPGVKKSLDEQKPNQVFDFIHCVYPNEGINPQYADFRGMEFSSVYVSVADCMVCNEGGYRTMPYAVGRYMTGPRETYGRSPAMTVFRDILMLNEMNKTAIRTAQLQADPPFLLAEEGALQAFSMRPGSNNYGYLSDDGSPLAQALRPDGDPSMMLEMIQDRRTAINDGFMLTLFQILVEAPDKTATEALLRAQEKGQLLGPAMSRQQSAIGSIIERELDILSAAGQLPEMPEQLVERGGGFAVEFKAPVNRLQKTDAAIGVLRTLEALAGAAEIDPSAYDVFAGKWAQIGRAIGEANGAPATLMNDEEEMAALAAAREERQQIGDIVAEAVIELQRKETESQPNSKRKG